MKRLATLLCSTATALLLAAGCGSLGSITSNLGLGGRTYTFNELPRNLDELKALPEASLTDPYAVAALTLAALTRYGTSSSDCFAMLNYLKGPEPVSGYEAQFIRERLDGKTYKPFSYFKGATPQNNYTPSEPLSLTFFEDPYTYANEGYAKLNIRSSGADSPRQITLRKKPSTGEWFLWENYLLSDIRIPVAEDEWA